PERDMPPDPADTAARTANRLPPLAQRLCKKADIHYRDGETGTLVYIKAAVTPDAPWSIRSFQEQHPQFPCDPTTNQLYTAERFDAYRTLGAFAMATAWNECGSEFEDFRAKMTSKEALPILDLDRPDGPQADAPSTELIL